jgi:hypothetical protein
MYLSIPKSNVDTAWLFQTHAFNHTCNCTGYFLSSNSRSLIPFSKSANSSQREECVSNLWNQLSLDGALKSHFSNVVVGIQVDLSN